VYDINEPALLHLDSFEDGYRRAILPIFFSGKSNQPLDALVYVAVIDWEVPLPNREYKGLMVEGAKHWRLSPS
jgi:hypothetical protein